MPNQYTVRPITERFWAKVDKNGPLPAHCPNLGPCWLWLGKLNTGYGSIWIGRKSGENEPAHRWAWVQENGPVPDGLELDHLCRARACVRPSHMEAVEHKVNMARMRERVFTGDYGFLVNRLVSCHAKV